MNRLPTPPEDAPFLVTSAAAAPELVPRASPSGPSAALGDERTSAWPWLLGAALLSMFVVGLITWLVYRKPIVPPPMMPERLVPKVVAPKGPLFTPGPPAAKSAPRSRLKRVPPAQPSVAPADTRLHAEVKLGGGGDPGSIESTLYKMDEPRHEPMRVQGGKLELALPPGEWHVVATAPRHAMTTQSFTMKAGAPTHWGPLVLEPEHLFTLHVPGETRQVRAGDRWNGLQFLQKNEELIMLGTHCVCVMRSEGEPESKARRCWVAMLIGERYLVRPTPEERWFPVELTARDEPEILWRPRRPLVQRSATAP